MIEIDGSMGEGGGQILRTSLALSILTKQPFRIRNIRANRKKPGLMPQHVKCIEAAAAISGAEVRDVSIGSSELAFSPNDVIPGEYRFDMNTAGSTSLVLQTIYLPLAIQQEKSRIVIMGGTHVSWSPTHHYLAVQWLPYVRKFGIKMRLTLVRAGFYPKGNGKIIAELHPYAGPVESIDMVERGVVDKIYGISAVANLPQDLAKRQKTHTERRLRPLGHKYHIRMETVRSRWKNTMMLVNALFENGSACFWALGAIGKKSESVADEAVDQLMEFFKTRGCIDPYLADQLILPAAYFREPAVYSTSLITPHIMTCIDVVKMFIDTRIAVEGNIGEEGTIHIN